MATEELPLLPVEPAPEPSPTEQVEDKPAETNTGKSKKPKEPKARKPAAPRKPPSHPPYEEVLPLDLLESHYLNFTIKVLQIQACGLDLSF
jgi:hypothetical protein